MKFKAYRRVEFENKHRWVKGRWQEYRGYTLFKRFNFDDWYENVEDLSYYKDCVEDARQYRIDYPEDSYYSEYPFI